MSFAQIEDSILDRAIEILTYSHDYEATIQEIAKLTVGKLATWCIIDVVTEQGSVERVAVSHADPSKSELADKIKCRYPASPRAKQGVYRVIETGKSTLIPEVSVEAWAARADDPEHLEIINALGSNSYLCVPLTTRGRVVGTLLLLSSERTFGEKDLALTEKLGSLFALAVDQARMFRKLQKAVQSRDEFISIASHELKTPITSLKIQSHLLERFCNQSLPHDLDAIKKLCRSSSRQITKLNRLVMDLVDSSKTAVGKFSLDKQVFNLSELIHEIADTHADQLELVQCQLNLDVEPGMIGTWDRIRIDQVVTNLLSNAIKYAPGKPIEIRLSRRENNAMIHVRDQGPGIPEERQSRIFDKFERGDHVAAQAGMGLGLYISNVIVRAHEGSVTLDSKPEKGATFEVVLPGLFDRQPD